MKTMMKICACQLPSPSLTTAKDVIKTSTYSTVREYVANAATKSKADVVVLPEAWALPYSTKCFKEFAESVPCVGELPDEEKQPSTYLMSTLAKQHSVWIVGGSIAESHDDKFFNTCVVLNPMGLVSAKHRKTHLFDIDIPGGITFKESDILSAGSQITTFESPWGTIGIGICYDMRFAELSMCMRQRGAKFLIFPGAFNTTTGPVHWMPLIRARALDTQCYVIACSPSPSKLDGDYPAYGHTAVVDPWGTVMGELDDTPGILTAELDTEQIEEVRRRVPIGIQRRTDLYKLAEV